MDRAAEKLSEWFGSVPFIVFHIVWFGGWIGAHYALKFDSDWSLLTLIVSLEAIFLALFILRAENVQSERQEKFIKRDLKNTKKVLKKLN